MIVTYYHYYYDYSITTTIMILIAIILIFNFNQSMARGLEKLWFPWKIWLPHDRSLSHNSIATSPLLDKHGEDEASNTPNSHQAHAEMSNVCLCKVLGPARRRRKEKQQLLEGLLLPLRCNCQLCLRQDWELAQLKQTPQEGPADFRPKRVGPLESFWQVSGPNS